MEERKMEDLMIDYVEGNLKGELRSHVERTIEKSAEWRLEFERLTKVMNLIGETAELKPDASLRTDFEAMLVEEMSKQKREGKQIRMEPATQTSKNQWFTRVAASVALVSLGAIIAVLIMKNQQNERELAALKSEMEMTRNMVMASLQNQSSASNRLSGVNTAMSLEVSDKEITRALVKTMNTDDNTNVRLAAVSALARFSGETEVRKELLKALETQTDPLVLINLINLMVELKEEKAVGPLKVIMEKTEVLDAVKDEAQMGVFKLS